MSSTSQDNGNAKQLLAKLAAKEQENRILKDKVQHYEEVVNSLEQSKALCEKLKEKLYELRDQLQEGNKESPVQSTETPKGNFVITEVSIQDDQQSEEEDKPVSSSSNSKIYNSN
jgi:predicted RNase H-like nuclease